MPGPIGFIDNFFFKHHCHVISFSRSFIDMTRAMRMEKRERNSMHAIQRSHHVTQVFSYICPAFQCVRLRLKRTSNLKYKLWNERVCTHFWMKARGLSLCTYMKYKLLGNNVNGRWFMSSGIDASTLISLIEVYFISLLWPQTTILI